MKKIADKLTYFCSFLFVCLCVGILSFPILILLVNSLESPGQVLDAYYSGNTVSSFRYVPEMLSCRQYLEALFNNREYINAMMHSLLYTCPVIILQFCMAIPAAFGLAVYCSILLLLLLFMLIPYQAVEIPIYMFLQNLGLTGTAWAMILPNLFQPFPLVVLIFLIGSIEKEHLEAAEIDGASPPIMLWKVILPQIVSGILIVFLLQFIDI